MSNAVKERFGKSINRSYVHTILTNKFYIGLFEWGSNIYKGTHPPLIACDLLEHVQSLLQGHNKGKSRSRDLAFRKMLHCAHDHCTVTGEFKKNKYVYYRCREAVDRAICRDSRKRKSPSVWDKCCKTSTYPKKPRATS